MTYAPQFISQIVASPFTITDPCVVVGGVLTAPAASLGTGFGAALSASTLGVALFSTLVTPTAQYPWRPRALANSTSSLIRRLCHFTALQLTNTLSPVSVSSINPYPCWSSYWAATQVVQASMNQAPLVPRPSIYRAASRSNSRWCSSLNRVSSRKLLGHRSALVGLDFATQVPV